MQLFYLFIRLFFVVSAQGAPGPRMTEWGCTPGVYYTEC